ncbi:MAG TPA: hypothetical protein VGO59_21190 [Verrucomicrobiae bacterium]|jgi:hypothetical protein
MKIQIKSPSAKSRASVLLVVLVFLGLMALIIVSNNLVLTNLDKNLRAIEQKQVRKAGVIARSNRQSK